MRLLLINVIKFDYEAYKEAFIGAFTFLVGNVVVSLLTVPYPRLHGRAFAVGALLGSAVGLRLLLPLLRDSSTSPSAASRCPGSSAWIR